jgi:NTE family protein
MHGKKWRCRIFLYLIAMILIGFSNSSPTQAGTGETRPKIGLALGGGGALGFAHIGVLKWFEEHRVPVDYISGTSMGGLVGGCYAMGMTPDEIINLVTGINWERVFNPDPPYDWLNFRRKEDRREYPVAMDIGLRGKEIKLPDGLPVHEIGILLSRITLPYWTIQSFDELPIPFRCVAVDIRRSEAVTLKDGTLAEAMRATMAIPGVFTPIESQGNLLVDGGILKNLPIDVVNEMGADLTVGVMLSSSKSKDDINGLDAILKFTLNTITSDNSKRSAESAHILIAPVSEGLTMTDWTAVNQFVDNGYRAAAEQAEQLLLYSLDESAWREYLLERQKKRKSSAPNPIAIEIVGTSNENKTIIKEKLIKHINQPVITERLEQDLNDIIGSGLYEGFRYGMKKDEAGNPILLITAIEKAYGPPFVNTVFLLEADGYQADYVNINARCRITWHNIVGPGSELRTDLGFGTELHYMGEIYKPILQSKWFVAPAVFFEEEKSNLYQNGLRLNHYKATDQGLRLDLGYGINKSSEVRLGYAVSHQSARISVGEELPGDTDGEVHLARFKWTYTSADGAMIDSKGVYCNLELKRYLEGPEISEPLTQMETQFIWTYPFQSRDAIFTLISGGSSFGDAAPLLQQYRLGGPFRLGTYNTDQFHGSNYLLGTIGFLKYLGQLPLTGKNVYLGFWVEHGGVFEDWSKQDLESNFTMGLLSPTVFGPVYFGASYGKGDNPLINVLVGKIF